MMILCFYHNFSYTYYLLLHTYVFARHIPPLIPFATINNILISVYNLNSITIIFKQACHVHPGADTI